MSFCFEGLQNLEATWVPKAVNFSKAHRHPLSVEDPRLPYDFPADVYSLGCILTVRPPQMGKVIENRQSSGKKERFFSNLISSKMLVLMWSFFEIRLRFARARWLASHKMISSSSTSTISETCSFFELPRFNKAVLTDVPRT